MKRLSVLHRVLDTINEYGLLRNDFRVLVGISGGADSVCLLDLLRLIAPRFNLWLSAIHINHQLRSTAIRDEIFVRELAKSWGIKLTVVRVNTSAYAQRKKMGLEEAARELRYYHYQRWAAKLGCDVVALGHNADDNLETVIYNLVRGSARRGVAGIPIARDIFIRPLLKVTRRAIRDYLKARSLEWIEDETNQDTRFMRNLIRLQVVPVLEKINPAVQENVLRSCELLRSEDDFLDTLAGRILQKISRSDQSRVSIDIKRFNRYNIVLKRRIIRLLLPEIDAAGVERVLDLVGRKCAGSHQLITNITLKVGRELVEITKKGRGTVDAG
ncbi:MAG: tRNA lysidine(34) synthetase TilS [candidate division WOR-3 bacterium]